MNRIFIAVMILVLWGCQKGYQMVTEEDMKKIITESLITDAILQADRTNNGLNFGRSTDTLDFYAPIVKKYGYTAADVRYTISVMAARKSNPLNNILSDVVKNIEQINKTAEYHYNAYLKFDTMAMNYYRDTLYTNTKGVDGKIGKYKIFIANPAMGSYELKMDYFTSEDYRVRAKRILYVQSGGELESPNNGSFYMSKVKTQTPYKAAFDLTADGADSLLLTFQESYSEYGGPVEDTSYMHNIKLIYTPLARQAREMFYKQVTGLTKDIRKDYEQKFFSPPDSIAFPIVRLRADTTQLGS